jgi:uncharacterized protein (DUF2345 family)
MTIDLDSDGPLACSTTSFVVDPALADSVEAEYDATVLHGTTNGPNRYTLHVPTEATVLSLGKASPRWDTDTGITGHTESHIHFETKKNDKTVVSLGGPAKTAGIAGHDGTVPGGKLQGYAMVTEVNAWHDAKLQHYLLSQTADISLRTAGGGRRAVVQADAGSVDLNGGVQVNLSGGGVSIAAGEREVVVVGYGGSWEGNRPHSSAGAAAQIASAVLTTLSALANVFYNKPRTKYAEGAFEGSPATFLDKAKWAINGALFVAAANKIRALLSTPTSPLACVKLAAPEVVGATAGGDVSIFGVRGASLGSAGWTTVSAAVSASLKGTVFAGVSGMFGSMKGYKKVEIGSDWGDVFVGAETAIEIEAEDNVSIGAKGTAHVASPEGHAVFGGGEKVWLGSPAGGGFGVICDDEGLAMGKAHVAEKDMPSTKIEKTPALRIEKDSTIVAENPYTSMKLDGDNCSIFAKHKPIRFTATSGPVTVNGSKILLK